MMLKLTLILVSSLPLTSIEWCSQDGNMRRVPSLTGSDREKYIRKKLNDPDNVFLRTDNRGLL